jgi:hypothetical protein
VGIERPAGEPVNTSKPRETPGVTLPLVPDGAQAPRTPTPAEIAAQKNTQRFAGDPVLGQIFAQPTATAAAPVAGTPAAAPLVFQNEDELLKAAMDIIARMRQPAAAGQQALMNTGGTRSDALSTTPYIAPATLKTDPFGIAAATSSQQQPAAPMAFSAPAATTSSGLGATTSGKASTGLGLGARTSGIFDERTSYHG